MVHIKDLSCLICKAEERQKWHKPGALGPEYEEAGSSLPDLQAPLFLPFIDCVAASSALSKP